MCFVNKTLLRFAFFSFKDMLFPVITCFFLLRVELRFDNDNMYESNLLFSTLQPFSVILLAFLEIYISSRLSPVYMYVVSRSCQQ